MPTVNFVFEDGVMRSIQALSGETLYSAALRNRIRLETDCLEGACATCKMRCADGNWDHGDVSADALSPAEAEAGMLLACQARPLGDCVIEVPYAARFALSGAAVKEFEARVVAVERTGASVFRLDLETAEQPLSYLPGQYAHLQVPGTSLWRSYSFATPCTSHGPLQFFIRALPGGAMSEYLQRAKPGDLMLVAGPFGHFYLRRPAGRIVMVAGGTGLAPMLAMLASPVLEETAPQVDLYFGTRTQADLFGLDRLDVLAAALPGLSIHLVPTETSPGWQGKSGLVTDHVRTATDGPCDAYLCGPPGMLDAAQERLTQWQGGPLRIFTEKFLPS
ncbi:FAD-binding oxidoreductase [Pigmentiphaga daeguensis]|uniref:Anthranilate 1,2-dioxygenase electron transfer component AntC n=1 Tax=Pigmentiphaga daeguensis TaxID=414049 RepID=A0ABN1CEM8_9BURK